MALKILVVLGSVSMVLGQRPFFAGSRPIGYPELITTSTTSEGLGNRFGDGDNASNISTTTQRLPLEANGDRELVDRLSKLPIDKQPFWFINWQAYEANRNRPQTYPLRPSQFAQPLAPPNPPNPSTATVENVRSEPNVGLGNRNAESPITTNPNLNNSHSINRFDTTSVPVTSSSVNGFDDKISTKSPVRWSHFRPIGDKIKPVPGNKWL